MRMCFPLVVLRGRGSGPALAKLQNTHRYVFPPLVQRAMSSVLKSPTLMNMLTVNGRLIQEGWWR